MADANETFREGGATAPTGARPAEAAIRRHRGDKPAVAAADVERLSRAAGEPELLARLRAEGLAAYEAAPLPYRGLHLWKYTEPARLFPTGTVVAAGPTDALRVELPESAKAAGVRALPLSQAGGLIDRLGRLVDARFGLFESLNAAANACAVVLHVPRRVVLTEPLHVRVQAAGTTVVRLLLVLGEQAEATVVEDHAGTDGGAAVLGVTEAFVGAAARLQHVIAQRWPDGVRGHHTVRAQVERDGGLQTTVVSVGGTIYKLDLGAVLAGPGARSDIGGIVLADSGQHMDHHTIHDHRAPHAWSNIDLKVVAAGDGRSAYTGLIRITEDAAGSEAYQENRNLLLSSAARAETIPELEILTDEVMCTHGATVAPIEQEHLFYLESRGIAPREALGLVLDGFFRPTLERVPETLRAVIAADVEARLARVTVEIPRGVRATAAAGGGRA